MDEFHAQIMQKRVLAIHDISCFGKCSLTVVLPILSAMGVETTVLPTAVLSTHTGGFLGYTFRDLTDDILPNATHFASLNLHFDAIYTGYLGSITQIDIVLKVIDMLASDDTLIIVDPVMADHGKLYASFPPEFPEHMRNLCSRADIITPNMTEAALLTGENCLSEPHCRDDIQHILHGLHKVCTKKVALTGVCLDDGEIGAATYDGDMHYIGRPRIARNYPGTGDIFASVLIGGLLNGADIHDAARVAVDFTVDAISRTDLAGTDPRFGVNFEAGLSDLTTP